MEKLLNVSDLKFKYSEEYVFDNLTFSLEKHTYNAVLGANNSGKTTLIRLLSGVLQSNNSICVDGVMLNKRNLRKYSLSIGTFFLNDKINFLFEDVLSEIVFSVENLCYSRKKIEKRLNEVTSYFKIENLIGRNIKELTEFEKVKVAIASSVMHEPKLLLLDDIYDNLSYSEYLEITSMLKKYMKKFNLTVLYTTKSLDNCLQADSIFLINNKKNELSGDINVFLEKDNKLARLGIKISTMLDMSLKLKFYDITEKLLMNPEEMVDELWK